MRTISLILAALTLFSCGASRDIRPKSVSVNMKVELDSGFVAQQRAIFRNIDKIEESLEWKYNKGSVIAQDVASAVIVIAVVAGIVVLSVKSNSSNGVPDPFNALGKYSNAEVNLIFSDSSGENTLHEKSVKIGKSDISFVAYPDSTIYVFSSSGNIKYSLGHFKTGPDGSAINAELNFVTASINVK